ncbi:MAG: Xaa-Pro peptidase family protein [Dysgonamonadaceae bacterium]|jgi:Xaa-Pro aminopeptidase|nr:Xaa-Pro peptidase family protein [Dysgonamonadaceae bacterium]
MNNDLQIRWNSVQKLLAKAGSDACLIATDVNIYYLTEQVFMGFLYFPAEGKPVYFVQRPLGWEGEQIVSIRKPEDIPALLHARGIPLPENLFLEEDQIAYSELVRLKKAFNPAHTGNASAILRQARMIKTPWEIEQFRISAAKQAEAYREIPAVYREGMTDIEFQIEIERIMRKHGSLGIFRVYGRNMNIFMGSVLTGNNAAQPSPFDFALGGAGLHPSIPIGASGETIRDGTPVMVDMAGSFTAYLSDMTRVFAFGELPAEAYRAHRLSMDMHSRLMESVRPGTACAEIYEWSIQMSEKEGFAANFMGITQQAKFVGHGVGLEINELPVLTGRSKDHLLPGMVFAYEPKFVLPGIGAVGNEDTYLVTDSGIEKLTVFEEDIIKQSALS